MYESHVFVNKRISMMVMMMMMTVMVSKLDWCYMSRADGDKPTNVVQGAVESLAPAVSDLSLKDSAKSDSTGGGRLVDDSTHSDGITPKSSVDCAKSDDDTTAKPSCPKQQFSSDKSGDKAKTASVKTKSVDADKPFNVISLLHSSWTLRYFVGFRWFWFLLSLRALVYKACCPE